MVNSLFSSPTYTVLSNFRSRNIVMDALNEGFPYPGADTAVQLIYVRHLLRFTAYCPASTSHVVNTILAR